MRAYLYFYEEYQSSKLHSIYGFAASASLLQRTLAGGTAGGAGGGGGKHIV